MQRRLLLAEPKARMFPGKIGRVLATQILSYDSLHCRSY